MELFNPALIAPSFQTPHASLTIGLNPVQVLPADASRVYYLIGTPTQMFAGISWLCFGGFDGPGVEFQWNFATPFTLAYHDAAALCGLDVWARTNGGNLLLYVQSVSLRPSTGGIPNGKNPVNATAGKSGAGGWASRATVTGQRPPRGSYLRGG